MRIGYACLFALTLSQCLLADVPEPRPSENLKTITVTGTAQVNAIPDKAEIVLGVRTFNKELAAAKKENDERIKRVLAVIKELGLPQEDYRTYYLNIEPVYKQEEYSDRRDQLLGYQVQNRLFLTLKDLTKADSLITRAVEAGANEVSSVDFQTSKLREARDDARKLAILAARDKAILLTGELGQKIGPARIIKEVTSDGSLGNAKYFAGGGGGGRFPEEVGGEESPSTIVSGQIGVSAVVLVTFELE